MEKNSSFKKRVENKNCHLQMSCAYGVQFLHLARTYSIDLTVSSFLTKYGSAVGCSDQLSHRKIQELPKGFALLTAPAH